MKVQATEYLIDVYAVIEVEARMKVNSDSLEKAQELAIKNFSRELSLDCDSSIDTEIVSTDVQLSQD